MPPLSYPYGGNRVVAGTDGPDRARAGEGPQAAGTETPAAIGLRDIRRPVPFKSSRGIAIATVLLFGLGALAQPESVSSAALAGMIPFAAILALTALGQTLVIQQGGIDLSVAGVVSLSGVIVSYFGSSQPGMGGSGLSLAVLYALAAALIAGAINGVLVSRARVAPIVATIGMNSVLYGVDVSISGGTPVQVPAVLSRFVDYKILGITSLAYIAVATTAIAIVLVKKTVFGRRFEAVGANPRAARAAGVISGRYQLAAYMGAALLYCSAGIFLAGLMQLPSAFQGDNYLMPSIAAVVLGGTSLFGGAGNLTATVIAALFLTQLQQLVLITGFSVGVQYLFQGGAIVVGVAVYSVKFRQIAALFRRSSGQGLAPSAAGG